MEKRGLSENFMEELKTGFLRSLLSLIQKDHTLLLQIRNEYINIYYRGGNILNLVKNDSFYKAFFDKKYCKKNLEKEKHLKGLPLLITKEDEINKWLDIIPTLKQIMDAFFSTRSKHEREFQQLVTRENNNSIISNDTDYFITDIEYTNKDSNKTRFDLIGIKWLSQSAERKKINNCRLALIEMKYGDASLSGDSGIEKHLKDIETFCGDKTKLDRLKAETINSFKQLRDLDLIKFSKNGNRNTIEEFSVEKPEFILLIVNHKPAKSELKREFDKIRPLTNVDIKIATSSFMGYGLYDKNMLSLEKFNDLFLV